jgi:Glycosyltransferases, probably involved in cell wall biogenesis
VPAFNEEATVADTILSLQSQTLQPAEIIVVDDCSTDRTAVVARSCGVKAVRPPFNTGSKAGAQTFALPLITTEFTMAVDADTTLAPDAIEKLLLVLADCRVAAASGFVVPRRVRTLWERGRYVEYLLAFTWYKPIQDYYDKPLISSGCFSIYRTASLTEIGGWSARTLAEDMDLTWEFYLRGFRVRFAPDAVCYPVEPFNYRFMSKQLRRWSHGFVQNVKIHWRDVTTVPYLGAFIAVALGDAVAASLFYLLVLPLIAILTRNPIYLVAYVIDIPVVIIPVAFTAYKRRELPRALLSIPCFFVLRTVNAIFILRALFAELVVRRSFRTYQKGH